MGRGPCARFHLPAQAGPEPPRAQWPFQMMDRGGCPDAADAGLHLASIAPQGPRSMAARDEWLRIDFHLIDNLVNLFAESQVGPEREPGGIIRWGRGSLGWGGRQGAAEASRPWGGGDSARPRAHHPSPARLPQQPCAWGLILRESVYKAACPVGMGFSLWSGIPPRVGSDCSDLRGGLKSLGWDMIPAQPISYTARVLPPGYSDPQFLF